MCGGGVAVNNTVRLGVTINPPKRGRIGFRQQSEGAGMEEWRGCVRPSGVALESCCIV